jgi:broad specificity phosphatase PhoE
LSNFRPAGYFVRHAPTSINVAGLYRGDIDAGLNADGIKKAQVLGQLLSKCGVTSLASDTMKRTRQTAAIIAKTIGFDSGKVRWTPILKTLGVGGLSGQDEDMVNAIVADHIKNHPDQRIPGGESYEEFVDRVWPEIQLFLAEIQVGGVPVMVSHGRVGTLLHAFILGKGERLSRELLTNDATQPPGSMVAIRWEDGWFKMSKPKPGGEWIAGGPDT